MMLASFLEDPNCMLEELQINEADLDVESIDIIMDALYKADHLKRLSLSKNLLTYTLCQHLSIVP